jgi:hypothetical protein
LQKSRDGVGVVKMLPRFLKMSMGWGVGRSGRGGDWGWGIGVYGVVVVDLEGEIGAEIWSSRESISLRVSYATNWLLATWWGSIGSGGT